MAMRRGRPWLPVLALTLALHGAVGQRDDLSIQADDLPVQGLFWRCDVLVLGVEYSAITNRQMAELSNAYVEAVQEIMNVSDLVIASVDGCMDSISLSPRDLLHIRGITLSFAVRSVELLTGRSVYDALWSDNSFEAIRGATRRVLALRANLSWSSIRDVGVQAFDEDGDGQLESRELRSLARSFAGDDVTRWDNETIWDASYERWRSFIHNDEHARSQRADAEERAWQEVLAEFNATHETWENISNITKEDLGFNYTISDADFLTRIVQNDLMHVFFGGHHLEEAACKLGVVKDGSGDVVDCDLPAAVLIDREGADLIHVQPMVAEDGQLLSLPTKEASACGPPISAQRANAGDAEGGAAWDELGTEFIAAADAPVPGGVKPEPAVEKEAVAVAQPGPADSSLFGAVNLTHVAGKFEAHAKAALGVPANSALKVPGKVAAVLAMAAGSTVLLAALAAGECRCQRRRPADQQGLLCCGTARGGFVVAAYGPLPELSSAATAARQAAAAAALDSAA